MTPRRSFRSSGAPLFGDAPGLESLKRVARDDGVALRCEAPDGRTEGGQGPGAVRSDFIGRPRGVSVARRSRRDGLGIGAASAGSSTVTSEQSQIAVGIESATMPPAAAADQ